MWIFLGFIPHSVTLQYHIAGPSRVGMTQMSTTNYQPESREPLTGGEGKEEREKKGEDMNRCRKDMSSDAPGECARLFFRFCGHLSALG